MEWESYGIRITQFLLTIAGIAFLYSFRHRFRKAVRIGILGLVAILANQVFLLFFFDIWWTLQVKMGIDGRWGLRALWAVLHFLTVAGVGLILWAIVSDRRPAAGQVGAESADVED